MAKQKYERGDRVLLKKEYDSSHSHFSFKGQEVIIKYSYGDRYERPGHGGGYSVLGQGITPKGEKIWYSSSWYEENMIASLVRSKHPEDMALLEKHWNK